jgi:hypothetical protein
MLPKLTDAAGMVNADKADGAVTTPIRTFRYGATDLAGRETNKLPYPRRYCLICLIRV